MWQQLQDAIIQLLKLQAVPLSLNSQLIYNYEPTKPLGYPCISVTPFSGIGLFADTQRNRRDYVFQVRCYMERITIGTQQAGLVPEQEAERVLVGLIDSLLDIFDNYQNYQLLATIPGLVFVKPIPQDWGYVSAPNPNTRIADIKLDAVVVL